MKREPCTSLKRRCDELAVCQCPHGTYEALKRQFQREHPEATPAKYTAAMQALARKAGV